MKVIQYVQSKGTGLYSVDLDPEPVEMLVRNANVGHQSVISTSECRIDTDKANIAPKVESVIIKSNEDDTEQWECSSSGTLRWRKTTINIEPRSLDAPKTVYESCIDGMSLNATTHVIFSRGFKIRDRETS